MNEHHDTSLWLLAAVPLGATLVLHAVFGPVPLVWLATAVLNLILLILDSRQAKNEGNGYSFWLFLSGLIIMPFYLYRRTVKTSGKYQYLAAWIILYQCDLALLQIL